MITITNGMRTARVWMEDVPEFHYRGPTHCHVKLPCTSPSKGARRLAVELFVPLGARCLYGALGAEFVPSTDGELGITVVRSDVAGMRIDWALASAIDEVRSGLPREYADAVADMVLAAPDLTNIGCGRLRIEMAAYGSISSNISTFKRLTLAVHHLMALEILPEEQALRALLGL